MHFGPTTPMPPPTYLLLMAEYMATLEMVVATGKFAPFVMDQAKQRLAQLERITVQDISITTICEELQEAKGLPCLLQPVR